MAKKEETINIRPIDNGYIISRETYGGKDGYSRTEKYSKTNPVKVAPVKPTPKTKKK